MSTDGRTLTLAEILAGLTWEQSPLRVYNHGSHTYNDRECKKQPSKLVTLPNGEQRWFAQPDK